MLLLIQWHHHRATAARPTRLPLMWMQTWQRARQTSGRPIKLELSDLQPVSRLDFQRSHGVRDAKGQNTINKGAQTQSQARARAYNEWAQQRAPRWPTSHVLCAQCMQETLGAKEGATWEGSSVENFPSDASEVNKGHSEWIGVGMWKCNRWLALEENIQNWPWCKCKKKHIWKKKNLDKHDDYKYRKCAFAINTEVNSWCSFLRLCLIHPSIKQHSLSACRGLGLCLLIVVGEGVQGKAWTGC